MTPYKVLSVTYTAHNTAILYTVMHYPGTSGACRTPTAATAAATAAAAAAAAGVCKHIATAYSIKRKHCSCYYSSNKPFKEHYVT
jgi:hypothetical protein